VLAQFIVIDPMDGRPVGLVIAYGADHSSGVCRIAASLFDTEDRSARIIGGIAEFLQYVFVHWPFRKLYFEGDSLAISRYASAIGPLLHEEGRLKNHVFYDDSYHDMVTLALYREDWSEAAKAIATRLPSWLLHDDNG
jgi:hypothetical protein